MNLKVSIIVISLIDWLIADLTALNAEGKFVVPQLVCLMAGFMKEIPLSDKFLILEPPLIDRSGIAIICL
jgi:hypothetical protein